jgi:hypothetical protein
MWILWASLLVVAAIGLLLVKLNSTVKKSGPVWKTVESVEPQASNSARVFSTSEPELETPANPVPEKALAARHS